jgi:hypothetical protein
MNIYPSSKIMPYVYMCVHKHTGNFYIGSRITDKMALPSHLDFPKYKTSSSIIKSDFDSYDWFIIAEFFDKKYAYEYEQELIRKYWKDAKSLNGSIQDPKFNDFFTPKNTVVVKDNLGNKFRVSKNDPKWISGEYVGINRHRKQTDIEIQKRVSSNTGKGAAAICLLTGESLGKIPKSDARWNTGEIVHVNKGKKKPDGFSEKQRNLMLNKSMNQTTKDKLKQINTGKIQSEETKEKRRKTNQIMDRKWMNNEKINKRIKFDEIKQYLDDGWVYGKIKKRQLDISG